MGNATIKVRVTSPEKHEETFDFERKELKSPNDIVIGICQELLLNLNEIKFEVFHPKLKSYVDFPGHFRLEDIGNELVMKYSEVPFDLYSADGNNANEESQNPLKQENEEDQVPLELIEGIRNLTKKKFGNFSLKQSICFVGARGSGKTSLINYLMNSHYQNPSVFTPGPIEPTKYICKHNFIVSEEESESENYNLNNLKKLRVLNLSKDITEVEIQSFSNPRFMPCVLIDTPGFDARNSLFTDTEKTDVEECGEFEDYQVIGEENKNKIITSIVGNVNRDNENEINDLSEKELVTRKLEKVIASSDVVLYLIQPSEIFISKNSIFKTVARISELNKNVIIVLTKFDVFVSNIIEKRNIKLLKFQNNDENEKKSDRKGEQEQEDGFIEFPKTFEEEENVENLSKKNIYIDSNSFCKIIMDQMKKLHENFRFGAPVVCVQIGRKTSSDGPHFFSTENLFHILLKYEKGIISSHGPNIQRNPNSFLYLRNLIYEKLKHEKRIPVGIFSNHIEKRAKKKNRIAATTLATGSSISAVSTIGSGIAGVGVGAAGILAGAVGVVGGVGLFVSSGVSYVFGKKDFSKVLMGLGGALITGSVALAAGGVVLGTGVIAVGTGASIAVGSSTIALSIGVKKYALQVPGYARLSMSAFHSKVESIIGTIKVKPDFWKQLQGFETVSKIKGDENSKKVRKQFEALFRDKQKKQFYRDTLVLKLEEQYYLVEVIMKQSKVTLVIDKLEKRIIFKKNEKIIGELTVNDFAEEYYIGISYCYKCDFELVHFRDIEFEQDNQERERVKKLLGLSFYERFNNLEKNYLNLSTAHSELKKDHTLLKDRLEALETKYLSHVQIKFTGAEWNRELPETGFYLKDAKIFQNGKLLKVSRVNPNSLEYDIKFSEVGNIKFLIEFKNVNQCFFVVCGTKRICLEKSEIMLSSQKDDNISKISLGERMEVSVCFKNENGTPLPFIVFQNLLPQPTLKIVPKGKNEAVTMESFNTKDKKYSQFDGTIELGKYKLGENFPCGEYEIIVFDEKTFSTVEKVE